MDKGLPGRICRGELFMQVARLFGQRSTCPRGQVGAIATVDGRIVASGYVGAPPGQPHCEQVGCQMEDGHCVRTTHAEANLVSWAARQGNSLLHSSVYSTHAPCRACARLLYTAGVEMVAYAYDYQPNGLDLLRELGVQVIPSPYAPTS